MSVVVVGGGQTGSHLARLLSDGGHRVAVVEADEQRAQSLRESLPDVSVVWGSGTEGAVLEGAGVRQCEVVAAVTGADETNLVVTSLARFGFEVPRTLARVVDPRNAWMFERDMGVDVALNQADILAHLAAEEMSLGEMTILLKLKRGQYSLVEREVEPDSPVVGRPLEELDWPPRCQVVGLIRGAELISPDDDSTIEAGDDLLFVVHTASEAPLARLLDSP